MTRRASASGRIDVAFDRRVTSHMSAGMTLYTRKLAALLPQAAPDLHFAFIGSGDNFDLAEQVGLPLEIGRLRPRLVHLPGPYVPLVVPAPFVMTIHDLIDLHYPEYGKRKVGPYYRFGVAPVARRARAIITDDDATADDLAAFLGVRHARVRVVPLGADPAPEVRPARVGAPPYFLYAGNHRGHKNLVTLVRAWATLAPSREVDLLLTGSDDVGVEFAGFTRTHGRLVFTGAVDDAELAALYRGARAYVHPALREGFGLPMLEAMQAGTPVIAARGAVPRVLAPHVALFEPLDADGLAALLLAALDEPAPFAARAAQARPAALDLTWERTARATVAIYRDVLA